MSFKFWLCAFTWTVIIMFFSILVLLWLLRNAHAKDQIECDFTYTAIGLDEKNECILVEFDEFPPQPSDPKKHYSLRGVLYQGLEKFYVTGTWHGKGIAKFGNYTVRVVK